MAAFEFAEFVVPCVCVCCVGMVAAKCFGLPNICIKLFFFVRSCPMYSMCSRMVHFL